MFLTRERDPSSTPLLGSSHNNNNRDRNSANHTSTTTTTTQHDDDSPLLSTRTTSHSSNDTISNARTVQRRGRDPTKFATAQFALLALVRVAEPIALTSIYPYAWKLVLTFEIGDPSDASFYSGLLIAAFAFCEAITGMYWGGISDRVGRKPVLLFGCAGTALSLLVVGFSSNFWMALLGRALGGLLNGNIGVIQTMVGELVTLPEHEPKAYAIMPFVWSVGTIIGPAIGGFFAAPSENFPSVFPRDGLFGRFPYLLPNLICISLLLIAIVAGAIAIEETHPDKQPWSTPPSNILETNNTEPSTMQTAGATEHAAADISRDSYGTFNTVEVQEDRYLTVRPNGKVESHTAPPSYTRKQTLFTRRVVMLVTALGIFTYHAMTFENLWPIFLQDERMGSDVSSMSVSEVLSGGLGLSTQQVGIIMSCNGLIALFVQAVVFPIAASRLGIWKLFIVVTMGHPIAYLIVPYLAFLSPGTLYPGIYTVLTIRNLFSILAYPVLLILLKEASPGPSYLGKLNGLAASVGAACRTIASPVAGLLYTVGMKIDFTPLAWWASAFVAVVGALQLLFIRRLKDRAQVRDLRHWGSVDTLRTQSFSDRKREGGVLGETVHIYVEEWSSEDEDEEEGEEECRA